MSLLQRALAPLVDIRREETVTALLMFAYAFLAMTAYNIIQPLTRSKLISSLGAVNVPWVIFGSGLIIGVLMLGYTRLVSILPRRWALPITQGLMAAVMLLFWALFKTGAEWVSVAFYLWGLILGALLISQFWTLANGIYDPRQAKRLFGFIGGGVMLGGATGAGITAADHRRGWRQRAAPGEHLHPSRLPHHRRDRPWPGTGGGSSRRRRRRGARRQHQARVRPDG